MKTEPNVILSFSEHQELLRAAGLPTNGSAGMSDLLKWIRQRRKEDVEIEESIQRASKG
jgi:hypothetical protein